MGKKKARRDQAVPALLKTLATKLKRAKSLKKGSIVVRLRGGGEAGTYCLDCTKNAVKVSGSVPRGTKPLIEVIGRSDAVRKVLEERADPVAEFLRGGYRVRGDVQYLSDLAVELKAIKQPL